MQIDLSHNRVGRTDLSLTSLGLGAASLGNLYREISDKQAASVIEQAWAQGMRYFDTAPYYGFGLSERRLGDVLRHVPRDSFVISTKVGRRLIPDTEYAGTKMRSGFVSPMPFSPVYDYSYDGIMRSHEDSLQRLGLASIDILLVHDIGTDTHGDENAHHFKILADSGYKALEELRSAGDIKAVGLGVNEFEICEDAMQIGQFDCFMLAGRYTLLEQEPLESFFHKCQQHGASLIAAGVYNSGILATGTSVAEPNYNYAPAPDNILAKTRQIELLCQKYNVSMPSAAIQFVKAHNIVASVCVGMGDARRVAQTITGYTQAIPKAFWQDMRAQGIIDPAAPIPTAKGG